MLQQSALQKLSASKLPMYSRKKIGNLSFHDTSFLGYEDENENIPKRKENKIMKLLKFKNKRENFPSSVSANSLKVEKKTEVPKEKEKVVESPPVNLNSSHLTETFAPNIYENITIKSEPLDPDLEEPVDIPNECNVGLTSPPKAKRKKNSLAALAKVNPKYIGITGQYICTECPYTSEYITHFERHVKSFHPELSLYRCEICQFQSKSKSYLTVHTMNHLGLKPYKCTMCDYASPRKDYVNMHMKSHTKEETHFCEFCDYRTYRQDYFNRHLLEKHYKKAF